MIPGRRYRGVDEAVRAAAVDQVRALREANPGMSRTAAARIVAEELDRHHNSIMNWVTAAAAAAEPVTVADMHARIQALTQQLAASQQTNRALVQLLDEGRTADGLA